MGGLRVKAGCVVGALALGVSLISVGHSQAADNNPEYRWGDPSVLGTNSTLMYVSDSDINGDVAVASVVRRTRSGPIIEVYAATDDGAWTLDATLTEESVGSNPGNPDIATDGQGWILVWQRPVASGGFQVMALSKRSVGGGRAVGPTALSPADQPSLVAPSPTIDGIANANTVGPGAGLRYSLAWVSAVRDPLETSIYVRDFINAGWGSFAFIAAYRVGEGIARAPEIVVSGNGGAAVGFELRDGDSTTLRITSRSSEAAGFAWTGVPQPAGGTEDRAALDGPWDIALPEEDASTVRAAWSRNAGDRAAVRYARSTLFTAGISQVEFTVATARVRDLQVQAGPTGNDFVTWLQQAEASNVQAQPYEVRSMVVNAVTREEREFAVRTGFALRVPVISTGVDGTNTGWVSIFATNGNGRSQVIAAHTTSTATASFWTNPAFNPVSGPIQPDLLPFGVSLLVSDADAIGPRALWFNLSTQNGESTYEVLANQWAAAASDPPGPPTDVSAQALDGSALVGWAAPGNPGSAPITGYTATADPGGATCQTRIAVSCVIPGLTNGVTYRITVTASNIHGDSAPSAPSNAITPSTDRAPSPPVRFRVAPGDGQVDVTWQEPVDPGSSPIIAYEVTSNPASAGCTVLGQTFTCTIPNLTNGTEYVFSIVAVNTAGPGLAAVSRGITPSPAAVRPEPPARVNARARNNRRVLVRWSESVSASADGYVVGVRKAGGRWRTSNVIDAQRKVFRLAAGKRACYRVAAVTATGVTGDWSVRACVVGRR